MQQAVTGHHQNSGTNIRRQSLAELDVAAFEKQGHHHNGDQTARRPHVLNLPSLIWDFGKSCMIVHCITSQPANV